MSMSLSHAVYAALDKRNMSSPRHVTRCFWLSSLFSCMSAFCFPVALARVAARALGSPAYSFVHVDVPDTKWHACPGSDHWRETRYGRTEVIPSSGLVSLRANSQECPTCWTRLNCELRLVRSVLAQVCSLKWSRS